MSEIKNKNGGYIKLKENHISQGKTVDQKQTQKIAKSWLERTQQLWQDKRLPYRFKHKLGDLGVLPDCLIVGAQKAGTTSLYEHLIRHPDVWSPDCRELNFFNNYWTEGEKWYRARFPNKLIKFWSINLAKKPFVTLESTPEYFLEKNVPARVAELVPNCKLIFLLRNPIERAYSHWRMNLRRKFENLSFEEALKEEEGRIRVDLEKSEIDSFLCTNNSNLAQYSYKYRGLYLDRLEPWLQIFSQEQIKIIKSEDLWQDTKKYEEILTFLDLEINKQPIDTFQKFYGTNDRPEINQQTKIWLREYFREPNQRLYEFLDDNWNWD